MSLNHARVQFTPDMMPSDITGHAVLDPTTRELRVVQGPVFTQLLLADEINRAPAKTQSALLEVMQEYQVTLEGQTHRLPQPFFVMATQNPVETEGTYPLPEAQLDRFMFMIGVDYPSRDEEIAIARSTTGMSLPKLEHVLNGEKVLAFQDLVRRVPVPDHLYEFAVDLTRRTRPASSESPAWIKPLVSWGAGPRAVQYLILGAKARAALHGSYVVRLEDIVEVADPVLRHRVMTTFTAESEGVTSRDLTKRLVDELSKAA
jgi:MoxR-like ATPase